MFTNLIVHRLTNLALKTAKFVGSSEKAIVSEKFPGSDNKTYFGCGNISD